jgi:cardiolipin synthase (CMP-forming)
MNLPNAITLLRVFLLPLFISLLVYQHNVWALVIFAITILSDALDGFIARSWQQKTDLGAILDPIADKLLLTASFLTLAYLEIIPVWLMVIVVSRDGMLIIGALIIHILTGKLSVSPSILGKITTLIQFITILLILILYAQKKNPALMSLMYDLTALFTIISGLHYIYREIAKL